MSLRGTEVVDIFTCPTCGKKRLESHRALSVAELEAKGFRANPSWFWYRCGRCTATFKEKHYGDEGLEPVMQDEWNESVAGSE